MRFQRLSPEMSDGFMIHFLMSQEGLSHAEAKRYLMMQDLLHTVALRKCKRQGHALVGTGYGNAESGGDGLLCTRCGHAIWHQFY